MSQLDLEEQEQIEQIKAFWRRYGTLILTVLTLVLGSYVGWSQWVRYQQSQSLKASAMFDELDKAVTDRDTTKANLVFSDIKTRYPKTLFAQQAGLLVAKYQFEANQINEAQAALTWVSDNATTEEYQAVARLRLAGLLMENNKLDDALRLVEKSPSEAFDGLVADRRGDILMAQGKQPDAIQAYTQAWKALVGNLAYRRVVEAKLGALGVEMNAQAAIAGADQ